MRIRLIQAFFTGFLVLCTGAQSWCEATNSDFLSTATTDSQTKTHEEHRVQLIAVHKTTLSSALSGTLARVKYRPGERFVKGKELFSLDCAEQKSGLHRAQALLQKAETVLQTTQKLVRLNTRSPLEALVAKAERQEAAAQVAFAKVLVDRCVVRAPFSGIVTEKFADAHQYLREGDPVLAILDDQNVELEFLVPSAWISWLTPGAALTVHIEETGKSYQAQVLRLGGKVDPISHSINVYAGITDAHQELLPGMSGSATLKAPDAN